VSGLSIRSNGDARLPAAWGQTEALSCDFDEACKMIWSQTGEKGPDFVFECAGSNEAVEQAVRLVSFNGQVIVAGIPFPDEVRFSASLARRKNLTIRFVRRSRNGVERAIEWAADNKIDIKSYVTHHFPLEPIG